MRYYIYSALLLCFLSNIDLSGQIISSGHTVSTPTNYPVHSGIDSIYYYSDIKSGSLTAMPIASSAANYTWYKLESNIWVEIISGNDPVLNLPLEETGYQVRITDNGISAGQYQCWVFQPEILSAVADTLVNTCSNLQLTVESNTKPLFYYDLTNFNSIPIDYNLTYSWSSVPEGDINGKTDAEPVIEAPVDLTTFTVDVIAFNGAHSLIDEVKFEPIAVEADFTFDATDRGNENEYPLSDEYTDITQFTGSALVSLTMNNKSKGSINRYIWEVYDSEGNLYTDDRGVNPTTFKFPDYGTYSINLEVKNTIRGCSDVFQSDEISVLIMEVDAPNFFTPDGDGINDVFRVAFTSVKDFKMIIINRWGRKVFQTTDPGDSWNGKIGGSKAAPGVYFYYIDAKGYNEGEHIEKDGPLHLIRGN